MESKNGGLLADHDRGKYDSSQVHAMIAETDQIQKTGVYRPNIWKYDRIEALRNEYAVKKFSSIYCYKLRDIFYIVQLIRINEK